MKALKHQFLLLSIFALTAIPLMAQQTQTLKVESLYIKQTQMLKKAELEDIFEFEKGTLNNKTILQVKPNFQEILNHAVADSRFLQVDSEGKASSILGKLDSKTKKVQIFLDFGRYMNNEKGDGSIEKIGYLLRLEAEITNFAMDADVSSIFAVGFAAKTGKIQGKIRVTSIGLSGKVLDQYITNAVSLSEDNLFQAMEKIAVLKSKINSDEITIYPDRLPEGI